MKKYLTVIMVVLLALVIVSCGPSEAEKGDLEQAGEALQSESFPAADDKTTDKTYPAGFKLTAEDAFDIFKNKYPQAVVNEIELDKEGGSFVYEIDGYDGGNKYEIKIDPDSGNIIKIEEELGSNDEMEIKKEDLGKISALLKEAATDVKAGYEFKAWSAEAERNIIEFEIEFINQGNKIEYKYNLKTGELIRIEEE